MSLRRYRIQFAHFYVSNVRPLLRDEHLFLILADAVINPDRVALGLLLERHPAPVRAEELTRALGAIHADDSIAGLVRDGLAHREGSLVLDPVRRCVATSCGYRGEFSRGTPTESCPLDHVPGWARAATMAPALTATALAGPTSGDRMDPSGGAGIFLQEGPTSAVDGHSAITRRELVPHERQSKRLAPVGDVSRHGHAPTCGVCRLADLGESLL
jgi:hypothetical protein